jgi:hypothetical protein
LRVGAPFDILEPLVRNIPAGRAPKEGTMATSPKVTIGILALAAAILFFSAIAPLCVWA